MIFCSHTLGSIVATTSFVIYDILTTLDRKVHYVWRTRFSLANLLFLSVRWAPLVFSM